MKLTTKVTIFLTSLIWFVIFAIVSYHAITSTSLELWLGIITTVMMVISEFVMCWIGGGIAEDIYALQKKVGVLDDDT